LSAGTRDGQSGPLHLHGPRGHLADRPELLHDVREPQPDGGVEGWPSIELRFGLHAGYSQGRLGLTELTLVRVAHLPVLGV